MFDESTSQDSLYDRLKLTALIKKVIEGFNATIFAYGPTGSGKTYTMEGYEYDKNFKPILKVKFTQEDHHIGLIPRVFRTLFEEINKSPNHLEYNVYCTYIQIYKENIYDFLRNML